MIDSITKIAKKSARDKSQLPGLIEPAEPYHRFLYNLANKFRPDRMLELGVKHGTGMAHMCHGNPRGDVVGVDIKQLALPESVRHRVRAIVVVSDSIEYLRRRQKLPGKFGLVHIDTEHTPSRVSRELSLAKRVLEWPGIICIDDIYITPEMREWWEGVSSEDERFLSFPDLHVTGYGVYCELDTGS